MSEYIDYARIEAKKYIKRIPDKDPLKQYKKNAMKIAADLSYKTEVFNRILESKSEIQIYNALKSGRNVGNDLKFCNVTKNGSSYVAYC